MTGVVDEITAYHNAVAVQTKSQYANKLLRFPVPVQDLQAVYLRYPEMRTELLLDELTQHLWQKRIPAHCLYFICFTGINC